MQTNRSAGQLANILNLNAQFSNFIINFNVLHFGETECPVVLLRKQFKNSNKNHAIQVQVHAIQVQVRLWKTDILNKISYKIDI